MKSAEAPSPVAMVLDRCVLRAHEIRVGRSRYHPYFLATDLAAGCSLLLGYVYCRRFGEMSFYAFVAEFLATAALYKVFLLFKARFLGIRSRSFLQDTVLFLLPVYAGLNRAAGQPLSAAFDLTGLMLPLYLAIARIGCFLGGCCYGVPWQGGVLYPSSIFQAHEGCRSFRPGADPGRRVFPVQLAEAAGGFAIFAALLRWDIGQPRPRGLVLPAFLLSYCALRFSLDFVRRASARPRIGALSEAQVYSIGVAAASLGVIVWIAKGSP